MEPYRLERPETKCVAAPLCHDFDRHAALEVRHLIELVAVIFIGGNQRFEKRLVLIPRHWAVEVSAFVASAVHCFLAVACAAVDKRIIDRIARHDRRDCIVKRQRAGTEPGPDRVRKPVRRQWAGRDNARSFDVAHFITDNLNARLRIDSLGDGRREHAAINRERASRRNTRSIRRLEDDRAEQTHFRLEQTVSVRQLCALESVRADQLGQSIGLVRRRHDHRPHLVELYINPARGELPRCFRPGKPASDDGDGPGHTATASVSGDGDTSHSFAHLIQRL